MKRLGLVIGGSIAAVKSYDLVRRLQKRGFSLRIILSRDAARFVTPLALSALNEGCVYHDMFDSGDSLRHVRLKDDIDAVLVAPASANLLGRMAAGLADDMAAAFLLSCSHLPLMLAPAMNPSMWSNPRVQHNLAQLRAEEHMSSSQLMRLPFVAMKVLALWRILMFCYVRFVAILIWSI